MPASIEKSSTPLSIRIAQADDALALTSLINSAFRSEKTGQTWRYDSQDKRIDIIPEGLISSFISDPQMVMLVGTAPGSSEPLATCYLRKPSDPAEAHVSAGAAWLGLLAVSPQAHRKGYGLLLLREAERFVVREWGVKRLEFDFVNARSELRAWYERCGYSATGTTRPFPYGEKGHEILCDGLGMVVLGRDLP